MQVFENSSDVDGQVISPVMLLKTFSGFLFKSFTKFIPNYRDKQQNSIITLLASVNVINRILTLSCSSNKKYIFYFSPRAHFIGCIWVLCCSEADEMSLYPSHWDHFQFNFSAVDILKGLKLLWNKGAKIKIKNRQ